MSRSCIYALTDPDGEVRYIGQTRQPRKRYKQHCRLSNNQAHNHRCNWLRSLLEQGQLPHMWILERCWDADEAESRHVAAYRALGFRLTNGNHGGADLSHAHRAKQDYPWEGHAPVQHALICMRHSIKTLHKLGHSERAQALEDKYQEARAQVAELRKDPVAYVQANLLLREKMGHACFK